MINKGFMILKTHDTARSPMTQDLWLEGYVEISQSQVDFGASSSD
jgi:hypothetical protein